MTEAQALADMKAEALNAGGIDVSQARQCAARIRALQASGYPMTLAQIAQAEACERRVRLAETFNEPKKMPQ